MKKCQRNGLLAKFKIRANLSKAFGKQLYIGAKVKRGREHKMPGKGFLSASLCAKRNVVFGPSFASFVPFNTS